MVIARLGRHYALPRYATSEVNSGKNMVHAAVENIGETPTQCFTFTKVLGSSSKTVIGCCKYSDIFNNNGIGCFNKNVVQYYSANSSKLEVWVTSHNSLNKEPAGPHKTIDLQSS